MSRLENFDLKPDFTKATLQIPALQELENAALLLAEDGNPIAEGALDLERFLEILDPENWVRLFSPTTVKNYRDINGRLIPGESYDAQMEVVFKRFLNPVARAYGDFVKEVPCELLRNGEWARMYELLSSWSKYQHWFLYACDPLAPAKTLRGKPEVADPTTLN